MPTGVIIAFFTVIILLWICVVSIPKKKNKDDYTQTESYEDAHKIAEAARRRIWQQSKQKAYNSSSEADNKTAEELDRYTESWQPYLTMLQNRYPIMNQYLVLKSWEHPHRPGEFDYGYALIQAGELWYLCEDVIFYTLGEETREGYCVGKDLYEHRSFLLPDDFFVNATWENLNDKLRNAGASTSYWFSCEAEDKARIEKLFTHSPYHTMFRTAYESRCIARESNNFTIETKESVLAIQIKTGKLIEKTRIIIQGFASHESANSPAPPTQVIRSERAVSYNELATLTEESSDLTAEHYKGMTEENFREYFD